MAIKKKIVLENGITTNYHRIVSFNKIINKSIIIEIASYIDEEKRKGEEDSNNTFINTTYLQIPYDENMTISDAYDYIKALDNFKNSKDI